MIGKGIVLFRIEDLQQSARGISPEVLTEFVHLVQHENGIPVACPPDLLDDTSGHGADIGSAVPADFRFVTYSA